jgi:hypothetical protein
MVLIKWLLQRPKNEPSAPSNLDDLASDIEEILETADPATKLEQVCVRLRKMKGVGNFLSWQMTSDLLESGVLPGCTEEDWMEMGPGAISGLERIFLGKVSPKTRGALLEKRFDKNLWLDLVRLLRDIAGVVYERDRRKEGVPFPMLTLLSHSRRYTHLGVNFPHFRGRRLTLKNMEHVLCEFSKYVRAEIGSLPFSLPPAPPPPLTPPLPGTALAARRTAPPSAGVGSALGARSSREAPRRPPSRPSRRRRCSRRPA